MKIPVVQQILSANDQIAAENRAALAPPASSDHVMASPEPARQRHPGDVRAPAVGMRAV